MEQLCIQPRAERKLQLLLPVKSWFLNLRNLLAVSHRIVGHQSANECALVTDDFLQSQPREQAIARHRFVKIPGGFLRSMML